MSKDFLPVTRIPRSGLPAYALVVGDPRRAARVADLLDGSREIGSNREYTTYRGSWQGTDLVVSSHGVGGPGAICMFQELAKAGVKTMIRVGTAGAVVESIDDGDLVIATAAIRSDGVSDQMVPCEYPAFSTPEVTIALQRAAEASGHPWHRGLIWTKALFFPGVLTPPLETFIAAGTIAVEMELSALLVMAAMQGLRAGGIVTIDGNPKKRASQAEYNPHREVVEEGVGTSIEVALNALHQLAQDDERHPGGSRSTVFH